MMKIFLLAAVLLTALTACGNNRLNDESDLTVTEAETIEAPFADEDSPEAYDDLFTIYLPATNNNREQELLDIAYANSLLQGAGLNISFDIYDYAEVRESFLAGISQSAHITGIQTALQLNEDGLLGDFFIEAARYAPRFMEMAAHAVTIGTMFYIPTEVMRVTAGPAALIRHDIYDLWGSRIRSTAEFEELLIFLSQIDEIATPGLYAGIDSDILWGANMGYLPLNLFLPEAGFSSLAGMFSQEAGVATPLWLNNESGEILPFYEIPEAAEAFVRLLEWRDAGLIEIWDGVSQAEYPFPAILLDSSYTYFGSLGIERELYTIHFFEQVSAVVTGGWAGGAIAAPGTDIRPLLNFLEWLTFPENYRLFKYGTEGVDHSLDEAGYIHELFNWSYINWQGRMFFRNDSLWYGLYPGSPAWLDHLYEQANAPLPEFPLTSRQRLDIGFALASDVMFNDAMLNRMPMYMEQLNLRLFGEYTTISEATAFTEEIFRRIADINGITAAEELVRSSRAAPLSDSPGCCIP